MTLSDRPRVSLVLATAGREDRLPLALDLGRRTVAASSEPAEFVVVDNGRTPSDALRRLAADDVRVVRAAIPGLSRARVVGTLAARGEVLVCTDDDVAYDASWLDRMSEPILAGRADAVASTVRLSPEIEARALPRVLRRWLAESPPADDPGPTLLIGAGMALRRDLVQVALWDPHLGAGVPDMGFGEETLFSLMALEAGARIVRADGPPVVHSPSLDRLDPERWERTAAEKAHSEAYIAHHWDGTTLRRARLRVLSRRRRLLTFRAQVRRRGTPLAPADVVRLADLVHSYEFARTMAALRGVPRAYWPRALNNLTAS